MNVSPSDAKSAVDLPQQSISSTPDPIGQNTDSILALFKREERELVRSQQILEYVTSAFGSPRGLAALMCAIILWISGNLIAMKFGMAALDPPPFLGLQAVIGIAALFTTLAVLIRQNRLSKMEERRAHLELQVNLLAEQKATKIINLLEELRRDLPSVKDRHDAEAVALQQQTDPESVLAALDERRSRQR
jgi:uncharacterized membrane protein